jgi:hypothetical protein
VTYPLVTVKTRCFPLDRARSAHARVHKVSSLVKLASLKNGAVVSWHHDEKSYRPASR